MLGCSLDQWSTSGVTLATGVTGCVVLVIRTLRARVIDDGYTAASTGPAIRPPPADGAAAAPDSDPPATRGPQVGHHG